MAANNGSIIQKIHLEQYLSMMGLNSSEDFIIILSWSLFGPPEV